MKSRATLSRAKCVGFSAPATKRRKRLILHSDASIVVEWLNAMKGTRPYRRVLDVFHELGDLRSMIDTLRMPKPADLAEWTKRASLQEQFRRRHNAFNRRLSRYTHVPTLSYSLDNGYWHFGMTSKRARGPVLKLEDSVFVVRINESAVIAALARLAAIGNLARVRLCAQCGQNWIVSLRIDKFCTSECRVSFHSHSEEGKRRHREAMRRFRNSPGYSA